MTDKPVALPEDFPDSLRHTDEDTPVPTWEQVTRSSEAKNDEMIAHLSRIVGDTTDEALAKERWEGWPNNYQRSVALLVDKIYNEGWLDFVGPIKDWPWDGGFFFHARDDNHQGLAGMLDAKSSDGDGTYIQCRIGEGLFAYLNIKNHRGWAKGWMETDAGMAALHVGLFPDGLMEAHFDVFNALHIKDARREDLIKIPLIGAYNQKMFKMHKRYELAKEYAGIVRTSANFYHMMKGVVPLSF
jgi:hypothetical protein